MRLIFTSESFSSRLHSGHDGASSCRFCRSKCVARHVRQNSWTAAQAGDAALGATHVHANGTVDLRAAGGARRRRLGLGLLSRLPRRENGCPVRFGASSVTGEATERDASCSCTRESAERVEERVTRRVDAERAEAGGLDGSFICRRRRRKGLVELLEGVL